jgi:hypothetical protein
MPLVAIIESCIPQVVAAKLVRYSLDHLMNLLSDSVEPASAIHIVRSTRDVFPNEISCGSETYFEFPVTARHLLAAAGVSTSQGPRMVFFIEISNQKDGKKIVALSYLLFQKNPFGRHLKTCF